MLDYSHCFRKVYTSTIYKKLKRGDSLNLVGKKNTGRKRLLEDIEKLAHQEDEFDKVILIDLNGVKHSFDGFEEQIREQLNLPIEPAIPTKLLSENTPQNNLTVAIPSTMDMSILLNKYQLGQKRLLLLLHNFDAILDNSEQQFPKSFFDDLNSFKNKSNISLCCVTQKPHTQSIIKYFAKEENRVVDTLSWLELRILDIPKPNESEIREEINNRLEDSVRWQEESQQERAIEEIANHQCPFEFLNIIIDNFEIELEQISIEKRIKKSYDRFSQNFGIRPVKNPWYSFTKIKNGIDYMVDKYAKLKGKK